MQIQNKQIGKVVAKAAGVGPRQVRFIASSELPDRAGDIMVVSAVDLSAYKSNPIVLWNHDTSKPIGTAQIEQKNGRLEALVTFPPAGISEKADEILGLCKSGVVSSASVGFIGNASEPLKGGGRKYTDWTLVELSIVSTPCNPEATVIERSLAGRPGVFQGRTVSTKQTERNRRRRVVDAFALKHSPTSTSRSDRLADLDRLRAKASAPVADLSGAHFTAAKSAEIAADNLARSAAAYAKAGPSMAQRLGELERLRK